jgi:hypothetical protein
MVVENVVGAQKWLGPAKWHYGSFYLWGDVPVVNGSLVLSLEFGAERLDIAQRGRSKNDGGSWFAVANNTTSGHSRNPVHELNARKAASAMIAKIPYPLALHVARAFKAWKEK